MFNKKTFLVAAWYVVGSLVSSLYGKKKPSDLKKDLKKSQTQGCFDTKILFDSFCETQKNFFKALKRGILSDKNKKVFNEKKDDVFKIVDTYNLECQELLQQLKVKWKDFVVEASEKLENLYNEKQSYLEDLAKTAPDKAKELKDKLLVLFKDCKKQIKK